MIKKTSAQLKLEARQALKGNYAFCAGCLVLIGIGITLFCVCAQLTLMAALAFLGAGQESFFYHGLNHHNVLASRMLYSLFIMAVSVIISLFSIGYVRLCYRICKGEKGEIRDLFFPFSRYIGKFIGLMVLFQILPFLISIFLGFLQTIVMVTGASGPFFTVYYGIMWLIQGAVVLFIGLNYGMASFIFVEEPEKPFFQALKESSDIMKGNRLRAVWLGLTFLGMIFLAYCSCGIGFVWVIPYMVCTAMFFYFDITKAREIRL